MTYLLRLSQISLGSYLSPILFDVILHYKFDVLWIPVEMNEL